MPIMDRLQRKTYFSESEESEEDLISATFGPTIEEAQAEMDIARFYRSLNSNTMLSQLKSKNIQTEHDSSGVPPSWIIAGQKLVDELYTGLGNAINNLHQPPNLNQNIGKASRVIDVPNMKYFKYENGYWRFKLDERVKFPADSEMYRQVQIIHSETFRNELGRLMEVVTKLRDLVSCLDENNSQPIVNSANGNQMVLKEDKYQQTEISNTDSHCCYAQGEIETSEETLISFTDISDGPSKLDYISSSDEKDSDYFGNPKNIDIHRREIKNQEINSFKINPKAGKSYKIFNLDSAQVPGIKVLSYKLHPDIRRCVSEEVEKLNNVKYENLTGIRHANFDKNGLYSKVSSDKRKIFALSKMKSSTNCSKLVNKASEQSTSKFQVLSDENAVKKSHSLDKKMIKPLGDHNIPNLQRGKSICMDNDFPCKRPKIAASGSTCKNFIKQNILASKLPPTRAGCSHVKGELENATSLDALTFTHSVAGRSCSSQPMNASVLSTQLSFKKGSRIFK